MRSLDEIKTDARLLIYVSDGTSGSDKVGRLLEDVLPLIKEIERLRKEIAPHG